MLLQHPSLHRSSPEQEACLFTVIEGRATLLLGSKADPCLQAQRQQLAAGGAAASFWRGVQQRVSSAAQQRRTQPAGASSDAAGGTPGGAAPAPAVTSLRVEAGATFRCAANEAGPCSHSCFVLDSVFGIERADPCTPHNTHAEHTQCTYLHTQ